MRQRSSPSKKNASEKALNLKNDSLSHSYSYTYNPNNPSHPSAKETLKVKEREGYESDSSSSDDNEEIEQKKVTVIIHHIGSKTTSPNQTADSPSSDEQKPSPISADIELEVKSAQDHPTLKTTLKVRLDKIKEERSYVFRKILAVQTGLSNYFAGSILTQQALNYFNVAPKIIDATSPTIGSLFGLLSSVSSFLGSSEFIHKKSFDEKTRLLLEIKEMEGEQNLKKYEKNLNIKNNLQKKKEAIEEKKELTENPKRKKTKNAKNTSLSIDKKEQTPPAPKTNLSASRYDNLGMIQSTISGYFAGSAVTTNLLALGGVVSAPASIVLGIGTSALFGFSTFHATKERKYNQQSFIIDKIEIQNQQNIAKTRINTLAAKIKKIRKKETPPSLHLGRLNRRFSAPAVHSHSSAKPTQLSPVISPKNPVSPLSNSEVSYIETKSPNIPKLEPASPLSAITPKAVYDDTALFQSVISPAPLAQTSFIIEVISPPALEPSSSLVKIAEKIAEQQFSQTPKKTLPSFMSKQSLADLEKKAVKTTQNPNETHFAKLSRNWDTFKNNHIRLFRTVDISQASLSGFAAGYSITSQFLKFCQVPATFALSLPSAILGIGTSALFAISAYKEAGEFIVSKELFDTEKRSLKKEQEDMKKTLSALYNSLEKSDELVKNKICQLQEDINTLEEKNPTPTPVPTRRRLSFKSMFDKSKDNPNHYYPNSPATPPTETTQFSIQRSRSRSLE